MKTLCCEVHRDESDCQWLRTPQHNISKQYTPFDQTLRIVGMLIYTHFFYRILDTNANCIGVQYPMIFSSCVCVCVWLMQPPFLFMVLYFTHKYVYLLLDLNFKNRFLISFLRLKRTIVWFKMRSIHRDHDHNKLEIVDLSYETPVVYNWKMNRAEINYTIWWK